MKESQVHQQGVFPTDDESPVIAKPGEGAFDLPTFAIAPQRSAILSGRLLAIALMRDDQFDAASLQASAQRITIVSLIGNQALRLLAGTTSSRTRHGNGGQGRFEQLYFRRGRRSQVDSQRNTLAVDHHHPLCAFPPLGFTNPRPPFFAEAKLPSTKASLQSSWPRPSSVPRKARQIFSHTSSSSHLCKRLQQVDGLGYFSGRSCQRAPDRRIHRIPSRTARFEAQGLPPFLDFGRAGNNGSINFHCLSLRSGLRRRLILAPPTPLSHKLAIYATPFIGL